MQFFVYIFVFAFVPHLLVTSCLSSFLIVLSIVLCIFLGQVYKAQDRGIPFSVLLVSLHLHIYALCQSVGWFLFFCLFRRRMTFTCWILFLMCEVNLTRFLHLHLYQHALLEFLFACTSACYISPSVSQFWRKVLHFQGSLKHHTQCGPQINSIGITWELVRKVKSKMCHRFAEPESVF